MNVYWLSKDGVSPAEGPYAMGQLKRMYELGQVTTRAQVCLQGSDAWMPLHEELEHQASLERQLQPVRRPVDPQKAFYEAMQKRDGELSKGFGSAIGWLSFLMCCVALVPGLGAFLLVALFGVYALICSVLSILQMVKGRVGTGVWNLVLVWIAVPFLLAGIQSFAVGAFSGVVASRREKMEMEKSHHAAARKAELLTIIHRSQRSSEGINISERPLGDGMRLVVDFPDGSPEGYWLVDFDASDAVTLVKTNGGEVLWESK